MGRPALRVNATELLRQPGQQRHIDTAIALADVGVDDYRLAGDIGVDFTLTSTIDDIEVVGRLSVAWSDACRRCLRPLADTLQIDVDERYAAADETGLRGSVSRAGPRASEPSATDPLAFPIDHGQLDLAPMVREEVLLGVPDAPLCRSDCPGLCPTCGADLQTGACACSTELRDERWAALDVLRQSVTDPLRPEPGDPVP
jgi:uncharacterized protein